MSEKVEKVALKPWTLADLEEHLRVNSTDTYSMAVPLAAMFQALYGRLPNIGLSGAQAEFAEKVVSKLPRPGSLTREEAFEIAWNWVERETTLYTLPGAYEDLRRAFGLEAKLRERIRLLSRRNGAPNDTIDSEEANARLFSAAPELLAALKGVLSDPGGCSLCDSGRPRTPERGHQPDCHYEAAKAAIAKAEARDLDRPLVEFDPAKRGGVHWDKRRRCRNCLATIHTSDKGNLRHYGSFDTCRLVAHLRKQLRARKKEGRNMP